MCSQAAILCMRHSKITPKMIFLAEEKETSKYQMQILLFSWKELHLLDNI